MLERRAKEHCSSPFGIVLDYMQARLSYVQRQKVSDVPYRLGMVITRLRHCCGVLLKSQSLVQDDTKHFRLLSHR